jgi:hypothetical protein
VSSFALGLVAEGNSRSRMDDSWFLHNKPILDQFANVAARIRQGNFVYFIGIQQNFAFAAVHNIGREALLQF